MLENWCWEKETLLMMCGHVDDHSVKFSDDMLAKLVKSKDANAGLLNRRQVQ
jgi:Zn-dependent oligopeptidase